MIPQYMISAKGRDYSRRFCEALTDEYCEEGRFLGVCGLGYRKRGRRYKESNLCGPHLRAQVARENGNWKKKR